MEIEEEYEDADARKRFQIYFNTRKRETHVE